MPIGLRETDTDSMNADEREARMGWLNTCLTTYEAVDRVVPNLGAFVKFAFEHSAGLGWTLDTAAPLSAWSVARAVPAGGPHEVMCRALDMAEELKWNLLQVHEAQGRHAILRIPFWHALAETTVEAAQMGLPLQPQYGLDVRSLGVRCDQAADEMVARSDTCAEAIGAVYCFVGRDNWSPYSQTVHEQFNQREWTSLRHLEEVDRVARGSFWCNFLTDKHIETLGGVDRIRREAPCAIVEESERTGPVTTQVRLQVTERFSETTWEMLDELEEYLDPLLP